MNNSLPELILNQSEDSDITSITEESEITSITEESDITNSYYSSDNDIEIISIPLCNNYSLCKQLKGNSLNYCNDCFLHFYRDLTKYSNRQKNTCPLCLNYNEELEFINLYTCNHGICYTCIFDIYWDKTYLLKKPPCPIPNLFKSWNTFLETRKGLQLRAKVINPIIYNNYLKNNKFNSGYSLYISKISLFYIPKKILVHLKDFIFYQCKLLEFNNNHSKTKYIQQKSIEKCPYCKAGQIQDY